MLLACATDLGSPPGASGVHLNEMAFPSSFYKRTRKRASYASLFIARYSCSMLNEASNTYLLAVSSILRRIQLARKGPS